MEVADNKSRPNPVFCALDTSEGAIATSMAAKVADYMGGIKLGLEYFVANGPKGVGQVAKASGLPIFLDLKFHDIPNTVAGAIRASCACKPAIVNVHAGGGRDMMKAAADAASEGAEKYVARRPMVIAVTVLTSMDKSDLGEVGVDGEVSDQVRRLAALAKESGLDGVVCSPHEVATLRADLGKSFKLIVPGVRPQWAALGDQKRVMTPIDALSQGADVLVIGRPITGAPDPAVAARHVAQELADGGFRFD